MTFVNADSPGVSSSHVIATYPNIPDHVSSDLHLKFRMTNSLDIGAKVKIALPLSVSLSDGNIQDRCWCSLEYTSCQFVGGDIEIIINETYNNGSNIEIYLDSAVKNPTLGAQSSPFLITTSWSGAVIDDDTILGTLADSSRYSGAT